MMQKLSVQLSDTRNKGKSGTLALGGFITHPLKPWQA
jgi:hypothetical protein